jgi:GAF domain-containing protein
MPEANPALQVSKKLLAAQNLVLEMIVSGAPLERVLRALAAYIEQHDRSVRCSIFLPDPNDNTLRVTATSGLPGSFAQTFDRVPIDPLAGPSGAAAYRRQRVILPDVTKHPWYQHWKKPLREYSLRSCWSTPIISEQGALLGVVAVYRKYPHIPG